MKISIIPDYHDLFKDEPKSFSQLIEGIDIELIIEAVSYTNAQLYLKNGNIQTQNILLEIWLAKIDPLIAKEIRINYNVFSINRNDDIVLFATNHLLDFLHECLLSKSHITTNTNNVKKPSVTALQIFKAYLLNLTEKQKKVSIKNIFFEKFRERTWPLMIGQEIINKYHDQWAALIKSMCFFDYFQYDLRKNKEVENFLKTVGEPNGKTYSFRVLNLIQNGTSTNSKKEMKDFCFDSTDEFSEMFGQMAFELETYKEHFSNSANFTSFKAKPLFRLPNSNTFLVVDWNLLTLKMYDGLIFDFYERSGIKQFNKKNDFINHFKPLVSEVIEKHIFKNLIKSIFNQTHAIIEFDDKNIDGFPDCYIRIGKRIFLIEIKDALFPANAIESKKYEELIDVLNQKYNMPNKGTGQLTEQIKTLSKAPFENKSYEDLKLKTKNLIVYPILIYTDPHFGTIGMESYLNEELQKKIKNEGLQNTFNSIRRLAFVNIDFFINRFLLLSKKENRLDKLMDNYEKQLNSNLKKYQKNKTTTNLSECHYTFEDFAFEGIPTNKSGEGYLEKIFIELDLNRGLD